MVQLTVEQALTIQSEARDLAPSGQLGEACFRLAWAALTLKEAGRQSDSVRTELLLAWCQDLDGRPWQAARTLQKASGSAGFDGLPSWVRSRALYIYARALWFLGEYAASLEKAVAAYDLASEPPDKGRAALSIGQAALSLGQVGRAEEAFQHAVDVDSTLRIAAFGIRAYLQNLAGKHAAALAEAEKGLAEIGNSPLENNDKSSRAVEFSALLVECATAKAFLGHRDARKAIARARETVTALRGRTELELARIARALALDLVRHGEPHAAVALLGDSSKVFARHGTQAEYGLTSRVLNHAIRKGGVQYAESLEKTGSLGASHLDSGGRGLGACR